jgi:hypothetical protein
MRWLLYEFLAETRLTVYRRLDIPNRSVFDKAWPREDPWSWTWIFQFNWCFVFELLDLLHSNALNYIEVLFSLSISLGARAKSSFEPASLFSKMLIFWWIFSKNSEILYKQFIFRQFQNEQLLKLEHCWGTTCWSPKPGHRGSFSYMGASLDVGVFRGTWILTLLDGTHLVINLGGSPSPYTSG